LWISIGLTILLFSLGVFIVMGCAVIVALLDK
jgi:hypothetical protein